MVRLAACKRVLLGHSRAQSCAFPAWLRQISYPGCSASDTCIRLSLRLEVGCAFRWALQGDAKLSSTTYAGKICNLSLSDVSGVAQRVLHPDQLVWVVVGDRTKVERGIRELGWGEIQLLDADGKPVR
jgi:hypothetical protein